ARIVAHAAGGRARACRDERGPAGRDRRGTLPQRPAVSSEHDPYPPAAAARARRRHPSARSALSRAACAAASPQGRCVHRLRAVGAAPLRLAGQRPRAEPRRRAGGADVPRTHDRTRGFASRRRADAGLVGALDDARGDRARGDPRRARTARRQRRRRRGRARREPLGAISPDGEIRTVSVRRRRRLKFQDRVFLSVLLAAAPAWALAGVLLWFSSSAAGLRITAFVAVTLFVLGAAVAVQRYVVNPMRSLANMLE